MPQGTSVTLPQSRKTPRTTCTTTPGMEDPAETCGQEILDFIAWHRMDVERRTPSLPGRRKRRETVTIESRETANSMKRRPMGEPKEGCLSRSTRSSTSTSHAWDDPLEIIAMKAEGTFEYQACCSSRHAPFDLFDRDAHVGIGSSKRVFIMGDCDQLCPMRVLSRVWSTRRTCRSTFLAKSCSGTGRSRPSAGGGQKVLSTIGTCGQPAEDYRTFWTQFGRVTRGLLSGASITRGARNTVFLRLSHVRGGDTTLARADKTHEGLGSQQSSARSETRQQLLKSPHLGRLRPRVRSAAHRPGRRGLGGNGAGVRRQTRCSRLPKGEVDLSSRGHQRGRARGGRRNLPTC